MNIASEPVAARRQVVGVLLVLASTLGFAVGPTGARLAFENGGNVLTVVTLRGVIGALLMALFILLVRQGLRIDRRAWPACLYGGAFYALMVYGFIGSVAYIPVAVAVLIFFTHPILIAAISHLRGHEPLTWVRALLATAVLAGLALVLGPDVDRLDPMGLALAALASASMYGLIRYSTGAQRHATSAQVNLVVTLVTVGVFAFLTTAWGAWALPSNALGWVGVALAGAGVGVGMLAFFAGLRYLSPVRATMLSSVEPLVSILLAAAVLGERLGTVGWTGVAIVLGALVLFELLAARGAAGR